MIQHLWENILKKNKDENDVSTFLKNSYLFQDLNRNEIRFLSQIVHIRHYEAGEKIFLQGDPGVGMYLILNGTVEIIMYATTIDPQDPDQQEIFITRLDKGDFFGELSLIEDPSYRSATAVTTQKATLIGFFKPDLLQVIQRHPTTGNKITMRLSEILGKRLRETTEKVTDMCVELNKIKRDSDGQPNEKRFTS